MSDFLTPLELAEARLPGLPRDRAAVCRYIDKRNWRTARAADGSPLARRRGNGWEYHISLLPIEAQTRLSKTKAPRKAVNAELERSELWARFERLKESAKAKANERLGVLTSIEELQANGVSKSVAIAMVSADKEISARTIHSWFSLVAGRAESDWLPALAPHHAGRTVTKECSPQAWAAIKADYLRLSRPSFETCYERLRLMANKYGWTIPTSRTLKRRIERELPRQLIVKMRQGEEASNAMYPAQRRTRDHFHAMEAVNVDGHKWDVFVKWPDGTVDRPMMVAIQDLYSNKFVAWRLDVSENARVVRLAFRDMFEQFGIPAHCYLDNGRAFASKEITGGTKTRFRFKIKDEEPAGLLTALKVNVHWTTPYSGQSKPIERAFKDLADLVAKHPACEGAYTGNKPDAKPENYQKKAVPLDRFVQIVEQGIAVYNARPNRRTQVCGGSKSFDQAFAESYKKSVITMPTQAQLRLCLLAAESVRSSRKDGVLKLLGNRFWSPCLHECAGSPVTVRFDPDNLHEGVYVYRLDGSYVGFAECVADVGFNSTADAKSHARNRRAARRKLRELAELEVDMSVEELVAMQVQIATPDAPAANVTRLVHPAAEQPARIMRRPKPTAAPLSDKEAARAEEIKQEMNENVVALPETAKTRYRRALDVRARTLSGAVTKEERAWLKTYESSAEFRANKAFHEDFGADWLEA